MTPFSDDRGSELRDLFFETAQELLQSLNEDALKLEQAPQDREIIRSIRRTVHTIKGDAAAVGFHELSELAHILEDALAVNQTPAGISMAQVAFTAADVFGATLAAYQRHVALPDPAPLKDLVHLLAKERELGPASSKSPAAGARPVWTEYERLAAAAARAEGKKVSHIVARIDAACAMPVAARQLISNQLGTVAQILGTRPEPGSTTQDRRIDLLIASALSADSLLAKCRIPTVIASAECSEFSASQTIPDSSQQAAGPAGETGEPAASVEADGATRKPGLGAETVLRVGAERIDNVLNLVGELIIAKSMLQQAIQEHARLFPKDSLRARFADAMGFQARVLNDLQRSVMKIRMVPVDQLFRRFPRVVRDVAQRCEKQVELVLSGQQTDVDKTLLDAIA